MRVISKALLIIANLVFELSVSAQSQRLPIFTMALIEKEGEEKVLTDEAKAQIQIPLTRDKAVLIQVDTLRTYQKKVRLFDDTGGRNKFKDNLGIFRLFMDVDINSRYTMGFIGKLNDINDFFLNVEGQESNEKTGTTAVYIKGKLPGELSEERRTFRLIISNKNEDRRIIYNYFEEYREGHGLSVSDKFLNKNLSVKVIRVIFDDEEDSKARNSLHFSFNFNPKTEFWTKLKETEKEDDEKQYSLAFGLKHNLSSELSIYGRSNTSIDKRESGANHLTKYQEWLEDDENHNRLALGLKFSKKDNVYISTEIYNKNYEDSEKEDDTGAKVFLQMKF